jgi:hypothetical protein
VECIGRGKVRGAPIVEIEKQNLTTEMARRAAQRLKVRTPPRAAVPHEGGVIHESGRNSNFARSKCLLVLNKGN